MSSPQELPSLLPPWEQGGSLVHTAHVLPLSLLLGSLILCPPPPNFPIPDTDLCAASMDPEPTANPHAELFIESYQERREVETVDWDWSPLTPPVRGPGWGGVGEEEPTFITGEDRAQQGEILDGLCCEGFGERDTTDSSWDCLACLVGHGEDRVGQGQQIIGVGEMVKLDVVGGFTLPSLKELGLDVYLGRRC